MLESQSERRASSSEGLQEPRYDMALEVNTP
jgi:hypothetical protein